MELRPANTADAPAIATIWSDGWPDGHLGNVPDALAAIRTRESFDERAAQRIRDTTVATVVPERSSEAGDAAGSGGGVVAGFVMVVGDEVEQLYVAAGFRGSGVAGALLTHAERLVARQGHEHAWLAVVPGNARARRFYERSGWTDEGPFDYVVDGGTGPIPVPCHRYTKQVRPA